MPDLLQRLVNEARAETEARRRTRPLAPALRSPEGLAVIAEMKARTPIMGKLSDDYQPAALAATYTQAGAAALSVLCQATSFGGRPEHLAEASAFTDLPVMRKDFIVDEYQVLEARAFGADAVLLIVAALDPARLRALLACARGLGMEALVEVHSEAEVAGALEAGATVLGVNHRDLTTFQVDIGLTERLRPLVPREVVLVAESGIHSAADARRMLEAGADAILVGEALMRAADPAAKIRELSLSPPPPAGGGEPEGRRRQA